ncbi:hypothetical protein CLIB1423_10S00584 [[Candida] railenensis]|uniref:Uncharacterized protein n=1 Tax=[Candida] railenensis TaxID=45579 RepID=A0A9P0VYQ2_9ASCO|nr:hypothetical protein CLIB1423_10S00584 [[Candida] railenensis]
MRGLLFLSLFTTFAAFVLLLFVVLVGINEKAPLNELYWSQVKSTSASTSGVRWTNYGTCSITDNKNSGCTDNKFAFAYDTSYINVSDSSLDDKKKTIKGISKAGFILLLVGLILSAVSLPCVFVTFILPISFLLSVSHFFVIVSFLLSIVGAALETYVHVYTVKRYNADGLSAEIGKNVFGIVWGSVAALLISVILIAHTETQKRRKHAVVHESASEKYYSDSD